MQTTDVRESAQNALDQGKSLLGKQLDDRTTQIGQQIDSVAQELRNVGDQLRQSGPIGLAAGYVDQAADLVSQLGRYLQDADSDRLIADLETVARANPWGIAAGALVLGFAASRFLKTSSARRYREAAGGSYGGADGAGSYGGSTYGDTTYGDETYRGGTGVRSGGTRYAT
ncbi:MAG TPA: hypothetical protein VGD01_17840 [Candidatus Elarobacter sp.]|jgi:hypothetical protein